MKQLKQVTEGFFSTSGAGIDNIKAEIEKYMDIITRGLNVYKYTINNDMSVDYDGSIFLTDHSDYFNTFKDMKKLPFKFGKVKGCFTISKLNIEDCSNFPDSVGDGIIISRCDNLKSLKGISRHIEEGFSLSSCKKLKSFEGMENVRVFKYMRVFDLENLVSLKGLPYTIDGDLILTTCHKLESLKYISSIIKGTLDINDNKGLVDYTHVPRRVNMNVYGGQSPLSNLMRSKEMQTIFLQPDYNKIENYIKTSFEKVTLGEIDVDSYPKDKKYKFYID